MTSKKRPAAAKSTKAATPAPPREPEDLDATTDDDGAGAETKRTTAAKKQPERTTSKKRLTAAKSKKAAASTAPPREPEDSDATTDEDGAAAAAQTKRTTAAKKRPERTTSKKRPAAAKSKKVAAPAPAPPREPDDSDATADDDSAGGAVVEAIVRSVGDGGRRGADDEAADDDSDATTDDGGGAAVRPSSPVVAASATSRAAWERALTPEKGEGRRKDTTSKRGAAERGGNNGRVEVSAAEFFSRPISDSSSKKKQEKALLSRPVFDLGASSEDEFVDREEAVESEDDKDDEDFVDSGNQSESDEDDDFEIVQPRKRARKPPVTLSNDDDDEPESQETVVTASSVAPTPVQRTPRRARTSRSYRKDESDRDFRDDDDDGGRKARGDEDDSDADIMEADAPATAASPKRGRKKRVPESDGEHDQEDAIPAPSPKKAKRSPAKKKRAAPAKKRKAAPAREPPVKPEGSVESYPVDLATPGCLEGLTFVFTGIMPNLSRDEGEEYVKILGGRVTKAVSGKTDYLVCGSELEDGRGVTEGSKHRKAMELGEDKVVVLDGEGQLYALAKIMDEKRNPDKLRGGQGGSSEPTGADAAAPEPNVVKGEDKAGDADRGSADDAKAATPSPAAARSNPYTKKAPANPYAKKAPANPYAKTAASQNPYAKSSSNSYARKLQSRPSATVEGDRGEDVEGGRADDDDPNALWADKYAPKNTREILGNQECVRKLANWLNKWEDTFNHPRARGKSFGAPGGPWKAALLSGPPGIGKTTTATLVAREAGRDVLELNASDARSKKSLSENLGDVTGSQVLSFAPKPKKHKKGGAGANKVKRCIIMDEVDGMGAGDRSGMAELIKMIKKSSVPVVCICNDRQSQKVRSLVPYCLDLRYRRPVKTVIARRAVEVGSNEGMRVEINAAEAIAESCGNDIRQVLNCLQMWASKRRDAGGGGGGDAGSADMTYKDLRDRKHAISKDEMLRVTMFDATRMIVEGRRGLLAESDTKAQKDSLYRRSDAFFTDYGLMGLNVHQNYPKVMVSQFQETKRKGDNDAELRVLERMHRATDSMSDFAVAEEVVRGGDQVWALLPLCSILAVQTGYHAGGEHGGFLPGYPEFAGWLGKNSSRGRKRRLLQELEHHMNYRVSADQTELRLRYVPALRSHLLNLMLDREGPRTSEVIELMDEYGLDRDDLFENLDEFTLEAKAQKFADLDSKAKAAFTREYNKGVHKSQALVEEQGAAKAKKAAAGDAVKEAEDPDVVNEDGSGDPEEEEDEEDDLDAEAIKKLFKKGGGGGGNGGKKGGKGSAAKKSAKGSAVKKSGKGNSRRKKS